MSLLPQTPRVFIAYAHADGRDWLPFVREFLKAGVDRGRFEVWSDTLMRGGEKWNEEIKRKLMECDIFVVLVSRYSMSSEYVLNTEISVIRKIQENKENVIIYPVVLSPTTKVALSDVEEFNPRPRGGMPLKKYNGYKREEKMCEIADELDEIATKLVGTGRH
jgi:TIR domain